MHAKSLKIIKKKRLGHLDEWTKSQAQVYINQKEKKKSSRWDLIRKCEYLSVEACVSRDSESLWTFIGFLTKFITQKYVSSAHFKVWALDLIDS